MTYQQALEYIASLAPRGWRLGLDRMRAFVERAGLIGSLGEPGGPQFIHVAGTNGKGSVTAFLQSALTESGYNTGAFFSPYVFDPRERVQFGRELISEQELAQLTEELMPVAEGFTDTEFGGITEFEFKTALAFLAYKRHCCNWVALEVGLGGRLDATNVVMPKVSVIVSIGLDHTQILGATRAEIAAEKAGVIKAGRPVVVGAVPDDAMAVIEAKAADSGAPMWRLGSEVLWQHSSHCVSVQTPRGYHSDLQPGIQGAMQHHNLAVAVAALDAAELIADEELLKAGAAKASLPGRLQRMRFKGREFVLDGAHNADAGRVLRESMAALLSERGSNSRAMLLTNMVLGHDPAGFYREIAPLVASAHVVPIDFHRAMSAADTSAVLRSVLPRVEAHASIQDGLEAAVREAAPDDLVLVTGSFYLVGEVGRAMTALGTSPLCSRP